MNPLFVGIDVSSKNNVAYLMKPDGSKHSSFSVQNNLGGAKLLSERIVSALGSMQLERVVIGLEATSIYGDSLGVVQNFLRRLAHQPVPVLGLLGGQFFIELCVHFLWCHVHRTSS